MVLFNRPSCLPAGRQAGTKDTERSIRIQWQMLVLPDHREIRIYEKAYRINEPNTGWPDIRAGL